MMGDLVVAGEGGVHGCPAAHHVREHAEHDQVADPDAESCPQQRIAAAPIPARAYVAALLPNRGYPLDYQLPYEQDEQARHVEAVG